MVALANGLTGNLIDVALGFSRGMIRKALITGSAGGIGKAVALHVAARGYDVVLHYNKSREAALAAAEEAKKCGVTAMALQADVTDPDAAKGLVDSAAEALGGLSVLVNVVGDYASGPTSAIKIETWRATLDSNLNSTFYMSRAAIPHLAASGCGRIVNFAAVGAQQIRGQATNTVYMIAKSGVVIYSKSLARELIRQKITVNVVSPGVAETSFEYDEDYAGPMPDLPAGRPATVREIVDAVWYFLDPRADYVTGQVLEIAGGVGL